MLKKLVEEQIENSRLRYSKLLNQKNIKLYSSLDPEENWNQVEINFNQVKNIDEFFLYLISELSPENSVITQIFEIIDMKKMRISYISDAYLALIFDKKNNYSIKKDSCIAEHINTILIELRGEIKACGGNIEYYKDAQDKTHLYVDLPVKIKQKKHSVKERNIYMEMTLEELIDTITTFRERGQYDLLPEKQKELINKALLVKKEQLKTEKVQG